MKGFKRSEKITVTRAKENIIDGKEMHLMIQTVFDDMSRMIRRTIGPCAGNTLITEPYASTPIYPSKDGWKVINNHAYNDLYFESIYRIIRDISGRMNEKVGDGTTTGIIIAADLYKSIYRYLCRHRNITPYGAKKIFDVALESLTKKLFDPQYGYIVKLDDLPRDKRLEVYRNVATISANNDSSIADRVVEVYRDSDTDYAYIDVQESENESDVVEVNLGFELNIGYVLRHMANKPDGITAEYEHPYFLLIDGPILTDDVPEIEKFIKWICVDAGMPLVICASEYCKAVLDYFVRCLTGLPLMNARTGKTELVKLPLLAIQLNTGNEYGVSRIQDLEACLGTHALQTNTGRLQNCPQSFDELNMLLGRADSVKCIPHYIRVRGGAGKQTVRDGRVKELEDLLKQNQDVQQHGGQATVSIATLKRRIGMLKGQMHCIKVGGDSYKEKQNRKMIYDDAIQAVKACIDNGIALGGQVSINRCINTYKEDLIDDIFATITDKNNTYNVMINTDENKMRNIIEDFLDIIAESSKAGFKAVFDNASTSRRWKKEIMHTLENTSEVALTYDIVKAKYCSLSTIKNGEIPSLIVPGNTDCELLRSVFCIVGMFISANQILSVHLKDDFAGAHKK